MLLFQTGLISTGLSLDLLMTLILWQWRSAPADLGFANRIVSWLVKRQNAYGGFSSTQDTVVALQALSLHATKVFSSDGSSTVTVQSAGDTHHFDVNQDNKLLYQEKQLQNVPAKYSIEVKGSTCVSVQIAQLYNSPTPNEAKTLSIDAKIEGDCKKTFGQDLLLNFTVTYNGPQARSNMVIVDIKLLSGFTADTSLTPLVEAESVQTMKAEVRGKNFKMSEERKVVFRRYYPLTFIQTDKPTYIPGQTVNFRVVTMDRNFVPFDQKDSQYNRIGQWTNISSTRWILQLSHELNPEARQGRYKLKAYIGEGSITHIFEVKKYVLPKFEITMKSPKEISFADNDMNVEISETGCASFTLDTSVFFNSTNEIFLKEQLTVKVLSRGVIVHHGYEKVEVKSFNGAASGSVSFKLSVVSDHTVFCPMKMLLLVSLQFSPAKAVPGEKNTLQISAQPGSLCGLSAVDQSVLILEDSGSAQVPVTVPDTITSWETEAFCLSSKGLGLAPPAQLTVFQPFFLELSLPYSIIREEIFEQKATVFNYLSKCIMDTVVALQALSLYATEVFSSDGSSTVTVQSAGDTHHFDVNQDNKLLYQEKQLQNVPAKYSTEVKGSTCVSVQIAQFYNIPTPTEAKTLSIDAKIEGDCKKTFGQDLLLNFTVKYFTVTFPAVIESGSEAKLCASLLKPNESLVMNIYLVHGNQSTLLLQEKAEEEFHRCFNFKAPLVEAESVQKLKVELQGESFKLTEERKVMFKPYHPLTFIQTDKPIYTPGQTVNFRIVTMDTDFAPLDQQYGSVVLEDSQDNRIGQWTNVSSTRWILQHSHELNPEAREGIYRLKAYIGDRMISHDFEVKKYVLLKFEVTVQSPHKVNVNEEELLIKVCGKYTFGQPVPGKSWVKVCRNIQPYRHFPDGSPLCLKKTTEIEKTGCAIHTLNVSAFLNSTLKKYLLDSLHVVAMITEEETEITRTTFKSILLTYETGKATLKDLPKTYKHGSVIEGKIKLTNFKDAPIQNKDVYLFEKETLFFKPLLNLTTDSDGLASFSLNTSGLPERDIELTASVNPVFYYHAHNIPHFSTDRKTVKLFWPATPYTPRLSELIIENIEQPLKCDAEFTVTIKYYFIGETVEEFKTDIVYMVLSRGVIVHHGYEKVEVKSTNRAANGTVSFKLSAGAVLAPAVQILAYCVLPSENVAAGITNFNVEKCFSSKVSLQFSPAKAVPGETNILQISAQPGSLCGLSAVDQSVLILKSRKRLDTDKIFNLLPVQSVSNYPYSVEDAQGCLHVRSRRDVPNDITYESLKVTGMYRHRISMPMVSRADAHIYKSSRNSPEVTILTVFPETWIWELVEVGDSGSAQVPVTVPDTITSWETEAFCLSSKGLGLAPPAQLTVFQPFILELSLPYSIIRGEIFELKATVFNYLSKCIMVKVTPAPSSDYTLKASSDDQYSSCLCANERKTFKWILTPSVLGVLNITVSAEAEASQTLCDNEIVSVPERGRIDTVTRSLLVQAEGTEKTETYNWLLCPKGDSLSEEVDLTLPKDVIEGSARSSVSVIGDILGRALWNLHGLLQMPYGCGEQNMAILSPNIYILQYLENTEQLTSAIRERATGFLKSGYQRQLNYRRFYGAYSTFGSGDVNTWLTAFVMKSFGKAQKYIFIDPQIIQSAKEWLISRRDSDGCFIQQGRLFNNRMKVYLSIYLLSVEGGVNDNVTVTAYITASLLELETPVTDPVITKGLSCLKSVIEDVNNTYTTALLAYTFSLARDTDTRQQLFKKLEDVAISDGSHLHWSQSGSADDSDSLAVEISSYVLLAVLTTDSVTPADLGFANRIVSWLVKQQNAYGGFSSTQDTVVALQALSLYATKVFSSDGSSTVTVQSAGDTHHFDVNQDKKLLYQEKQLQNVPAKYSIEVKGSTCVSVQVAQFYNIPTPTEAKTLSIDAKFEGDCNTLGQKFILSFAVKYDGVQERTNMVIVDIKLLSGFTADTSLLKTLVGMCVFLVERVDAKDDHVIVYLKEIPKKPIIPNSYEIQMKQVLPVKNLKPAVVKVYDYYQPMIESGSSAKLCASLLKPNESLVMNIYLVHDDQSTLLLQKKAEEEFHHCFNFQAPLVEAESVQKMKVELQGESFKMTEERKVMFKPYHPLTFIQTDKPIYIPGQTVNFRVVTMDTNFAPLDQQYGSVILEDNQSNRIGQWTNVSSTRWILQRSYELNPEAREGIYRLKAYIGDRMISHDFEVKKYVLPKFEVTVQSPDKVSVDEEELLIEVCGKYTYGQPVPGKSWVKVCRNVRPYHRVPYDSNPLCLEETTEIKKTGCAIHTLDVSAVLNSTLKYSLLNSLRVEAVITEEGTEITMTKSKSVSLTYEIGKVTLMDLPKTYKHGSVIEGKIKLSSLKDAPIQNKEVYLFEGEIWSSKLLLNLTTDSDGLASFSLNTSSLPERDIDLMASVYPGLHYQSHKTPHISMDRKTVQLFRPAAPYTPTLSELIIENIEQPLKCDAEFTVTIKYYFIGETVEEFKTDIVYMVKVTPAPSSDYTLKASSDDQYSSCLCANGRKTFKWILTPSVLGVLNITVSAEAEASQTVCDNEIVSVPERGRIDTVTRSLLVQAEGTEKTETYSWLLCPKGDSLSEEVDLTLPKDASVYPGLHYQSYKTPHISMDRKTVQLFRPAAPYTPTLSELIIENIEQPLKCDAEFTVTIKYYFIGETVEEFKTDIVYMVLSRGVIVHYGYEKVEVKSSNGAASGTVSFKLSAGADLAPAVQILAYCVLPSGNVAAGSTKFDAEKCFSNKVSLQFSPAKAVPVTMLKYAPVPVLAMASLDDVDFDTSSRDSPAVTIRTVFPETWIWELAEVGDSGSAQVPVTVPDTITSWETEAFCLSSKGLGLAPPAQLTVFQPFFLELSLPYSIIRGEIFELKATVFNYLSKCIMVKVTPAPSSDYTLKASSDDQYSSCLCANGRKTFKWILTPSVLGLLNITVSAEAEASQTVCDNEIVSVPERGRIDTVTRSLLVQAEGTEKTETYSWLLCPKGDSLSEEVDLTLPKDVIEGSARSSVSVIGDILGCALRNLHGLLQMPYGCGEQNMAILSPNIYILQYLENTEQLTSAIRERATGFLKSGYQRQLNYKHSDGAYSTFGYGNGNTCFAFVTSCTSISLIFQGGVNDNVTMTSYITASLLELETPVTDPVVTKGLSCLRSVIEDVKNTYTTALLAYTFSLARDTDTRQQLFKKLEDVAISDGSHLHWSQSGSADDSDSLAVEISSYVLLAVLTTDSVTPADLGFVNKIVSWLVKQQNAYGGFSSTQDTVVALQALSLYATKVFSSDGSSTVTVQSAGDTHHFDVNQDNKLLYQEKQLQNVPAKYSIEVKGSTCVSVQVAQFYNIPTPTEAKTLSIDAKIEGDCNTLGQNFILNFTVKYDGLQERTNMVIVDIKLLSGFTADTSMLGTSPGTYASLVERVDAKNDHVIVYLKEIPKNIPKNYQIQMKQVLPVKNLKPAVVKVYDYYQTMIESGSVAKLCASLLKPNESLVMNIYLVHDDQSILLLQKKAEEEFHHCFNFQAPLVEAESVQKMKVELQGESFKMTEERKVMFKPYHPLTFIQTDKPIYIPGQTEAESVQKMKVELQGESFKMTEERKVMFKPYHPLTFIQTDKPIYIPGQTVNFRVVTMDTNFAPLDQQYGSVILEDNQSNRIGQWTNVSSTRWILQRSYELNPEAREGIYRLKAYIGDRMISHDFEVKKYVLPKFEVTVQSPDKVSVDEEELLIEVCGKYTYGQPVPGKSWVKVCRNVRPYHRVPYDSNPLCLEETTEIKKTGCAIHTLDVSAVLNSTLKYSLQNSLRVEAVITEEGTEITMTKSKSVSLTYEIGKVTLMDLPKTYKHGSVIEGKIKLSSLKDAPIQNKEVYLFEGEIWSSKLLLNLTTDSDGLASFSLNTSSLPERDIDLMASVYPGLHYQSHKTPHISMDRKTVQLFRPAAPYTPTLSELIIENIEQPLKCDAEFTVTIKYYFIGETVEEFKTDIVYMVLSRGVIVHYGYEKVEVKSFNGAASGTVSFKLSAGADLAPAVQILAYCVLPSGNVAAGSTKFDAEKCFSNKVSLQFSPAKAVPGEKNTLQISAQPGSLCGLSAVDQSVLILESEKRLDTDKIFNLLPVQSVSDYPYNVEDWQGCLHVRSRRALPTDNAYESLKRVGLKMATNLAVRVPECLSYRGLTYHRYHVIIAPLDPVPVLEMALLEDGDFDTSSRDSPAVTIRTVFPETWIWELAEVGDSGSAQVPVTVPDTITSWETEVFCLSSKGLGLAPPAQLTVFQPFFLELSLPYSIIRGEIFELKATVFNYLSKCIMVKVTPAPSSDYTLKASSDDQYSSCLCANGRKTFKWILTPSVLGVLNITVSAEAEVSQTLCDNEIVSVPERGRIDTVTRSLLVQAEGTEKTETYSWLLCPKGDSLSEEVDLTLPKDVIEGSARSSVSVIGDILGRALRNLDGLLQMPYGCGEQNMAILSPNIYILQYLENTEQLTSAIRERATGFLKSGYQKQLNYKHSDGAYSTFGYGNGNTWLTAFVLRSFGKAQKYIFIDPQIIQSAKEWLINRRDSDGCFIQQGRLFNNRMKVCLSIYLLSVEGGVNDNVTMTAYITASLLELETPVTDPVVTKGLSCLRSVIEDVKNTYTTALLAYTFSLARDTDTRQQLFKKLQDVAISEGSHLHWSQSGSAEDSDSLAVEISSYVLLAVLTTDSVTPADLGFANRIVSWLVKQQNAYGGFSSTQDTVVALQALSLYATKVFSSDGSSTVTVQSAGDTHHFDVNQDKKLLYQEKQLQNVPAKYSIEVKGSTCVSVQVAQFYNIPTPAEAKTLSIDAKIEGDCNTLGQNFILRFTVKYDGLQERTNMVIVDIKLLSGFTADTSMLGTSPGTYASLVERVDAKNDHVIVYLKEIPKNIPKNYQIQMKQVLPVKNLKPAVVKVYDYYQANDQSETEYSFHC
ncbi:alpha-2-macroglobulin-like protein [Labeo rohita]|uniref:Alpha-2-macroglobulin-like protein n=1 Tax=Labeo rohita TaxID=84645 RepID=A0A498P385_LABRO|nr:alpha-2-macroglobulin-like protein [Labeo rohita]